VVGNYLKYSLKGPSIRMMNIDSTVSIKMMLKRKSPNVLESDLRVPIDGSTYCFVRYEPIIINAPIIGINLPSSMGIQVVRFQKGVLLPKPENSDPLPAMLETYS